MKTILISIIMFLMFCSSGFAQTLEERIKVLEDALKKQEQTIKEQQKIIEELKADIKKGKPEEQQQMAQPKEAPKETPPPAPPEMKQATPAEQQQIAQPKEAPAPAAKETQKKSTLEQVQEQVEQLKEEVGQVVEAQKKNILSVFNPAIGLVTDVIPSYTSQPSTKTGKDRPGGFDFWLRSVELDLAASVDPFARAYAVLNASADPVTGEASFTVEEAAIQSTSLPWNLTLKAGRFFAEFGRLSYIHDHELPFVYRPLVLDEYIGGESKTDGFQLNFLFPLPHYLSLTAGIGDQFGDTPNDVGAFRHFNQLNFWSRMSTYFDLTPNISLETGFSGLINPSTTDRGGLLVQPDGSIMIERQRRVLDLDLTVRYQPLRNNQFKSLIWGAELLYSDNCYLVNPTGIPGKALFNRTVGSFGLYSYLAYKFHRQWTAGFLYQWLENPQNNNIKISAYSPYITWAISHWNQLRLQYTYTARNGAFLLRDDSNISLQWSWIIGSHAHGWQER